MPTGARRRAWTVVSAIGIAASTAACSGSPSAGSAQRTAEAAIQASVTHDSSALCALLAPDTAQQLEQQQSAPCADAIQSLNLGQPSDPGPAQVWGSSALVPMGPDAVFLTDVNGRWRVFAAGCTLRGEHPADCKLGGG
jgi:hypothetical protein